MDNAAALWKALEEGRVWTGKEAVAKLRFLAEAMPPTFEISEHVAFDWSPDKLPMIEDDLDPARVEALRAGAPLDEDEEELFFDSFDMVLWETAALFELAEPTGRRLWAVLLTEGNERESECLSAAGPFANRDAAIAQAAEFGKSWNDWCSPSEDQSLIDGLAQLLRRPPADL